MSHAGQRFQRRRRPRSASLGVAALVGLLLVVRACVEGDTGPTAPAPPGPTSAATSADEVSLQRVVDGDTLLLEDGTRVRLIGVNTPESVKPDTPPEPWGAEASQFTRDFLAGGKLRLEYDGDRLDQFGRTLAYVWVGDRMLNEELLRAGLARPMLRFNYSSAMKDRFRRASDEARAAERGLWSQYEPAAARKAA